MKIWRETCLGLEKEAYQVRLMYQYYRDYVSKKNEFSSLVSDPKWLDSLCGLEARLKDKIFKIAVVGMEKAGKSTFINAWLGDEILPYAPERCTYTTTNIISVDSDEKQNLLVNFHTRETFQDMVSNLEEESGTQTEEQRRALSDLNNIKLYSSSIRNQLDSAAASDYSWSYNFNNLSSIKEQLVKYVTNPEFIYAVRSVTLFTSKLIQVHGVAFFDVPGLNSGLKKHQTETREVLNDCDAIIIVQDIERPSLTESEKKIVQYATERVYGSSISEKSFVFLSKADKLRSGSTLKSNMDVAYKQWFEVAGIPPARILIGSPGAHLVLTLTPSASLMSQVGTPEKVNHSLDFLTTESGMTRDEILGVDRAVDKINNFVLNEATESLKKYFGVIKNTLLAEVYAAILKESEEAVSAPLAGLTDEAHYKTTLKAHMMNIIHDLDSELLLQLRGNSSSESTVNKVTSRAHAHLLESIDRHPLFQDFNSQKNYITTLLRSYELSKLSPVTSNESIRQTIYRSILSDIEVMANGMSVHLTNEINEILIQRQSALFGLIDLRRAIENNYKISFSSEFSVAFRCLFMRYAKMLMDLFVLYPRGTTSRSRFLDHESDLEAFEAYIETSSDDKHSVYSKIRPHILSLDAVGVDAVDKKDQTDCIFDEISRDLNAFKYYLSYSNFQAAGFSSFVDNELNSLCTKLTDERVRDAICLRFIDAVYSGDEAVISRLPSHLVDTVLRKADSSVAFVAMREFYDRYYL